MFLAGNKAQRSEPFRQEMSGLPTVQFGGQRPFAYYKGLFISEFESNNE